MKKIILMLFLLMPGCLILFDTDCDPYDPDYSHTDYDCYYATERVDVCDRNYCWEEYREVQVCDEYHVCYEDNRRRR